MKRRRSERGTLTIEAVLVVSFLLTFSLASLDIGTAWRASLGISNAVRSGARVGSAAGIASNADYQILLSIGSSLGRNSVSEVERIVIFKATTSSTVPAGCLSNSAKSAGGSSGNHCNVYSSSDLAAVLASPNSVPAEFQGACPGTGTRWDRFWCPSSRVNAVGMAGAGPDYIGVYLNVAHATSTKLFGSTIDIDDTFVMRIEPQAGS